MPKNIVIIGASRGIGNALRDNFLAKGHTVYAFSRSFTNENNCFSLDLTSEDIKEQLDRHLSNVEIDILINNAGAIVVKPFLELTKSEIEACYSTNVTGVMQSIQCVFPKMKKGGHIVNISSMGGFQGTMKFAGLSAYSPSKAALCSLTELLAEEFKDTGISINCLCLGAVQTEMLETAFPGYQAPHSAQEMADFIAHFALESGKYFNGKILPVSISTP